MSFKEKIQYQTLFQQPLIIAQIEQSQKRSPQTSLINYGAEHLIDFGVILIAITIILIVGMISKQMEKAILFALGLSACLILILWNI